MFTPPSFKVIDDEIYKDLHSCVHELLRHFWASYFTKNKERFYRIKKALEDQQNQINSLIKTVSDDGEEVLKALKMSISKALNVIL
jgi:hypothetical protein